MARKMDATEQALRIAAGKYGHTVDAIAKRYGISGEALLLKLTKGESGFKTNRTSRTGAKGATQFMPGSRRTAIDKYGIDPWASPDEAVHAAELHLRGRINGARGLSGYNPGDPSYPDYILSQKVGGFRYGQRTASIEQPTPLTTQTPTTKTTKGVDRSGERALTLLSYFRQKQHGQKPNLLRLSSTLNEQQDTPSKTTVSIKETPAFGADYGGSINFAPGADRPGVGTKGATKRFARRVSSVYGAPLTIGTGTRHSRLTVNNNVSDHWSGDAVDIPARGRKLVKLGQAALIAAGMPKRKARKQTGGLYNINGHQIIFNTHEGGDHTDHLHVH